jgi:hypothetical protein
MRKILIILYIVVFTSASLFAAENYLWLLIEGNWIVSDESRTLYDIISKTKNNRLSELNDNNSIIMTNTVKGITSIQTEFEIYNPTSVNSAFVFLSPKSFRTFFGVRFSGEKKISKVELIRSEINDTTLAPSARDNYTVTVIKDAAVEIDYGKKIPVEIKIDKKKIALYIDNRKIFDYESDRDLSNGYLGYAHKNNLFKVYSSKILSGKTVVFEDTFVKDRIKRYTVQAKKVQ